MSIISEFCLFVNFIPFFFFLQDAPQSLAYNEASLLKRGLDWVVAQATSFCVVATRANQSSGW